MEVLFVCTGNASRSVMGEILFRQYLAERGHEDIRCSSAGTDAIEGLEACPQTMEVCEEIGVDLSGHRRRMLTKELVDRADVIVVMQQSHIDAVTELGGEAKLHLLNGGIKDPYPNPIGPFYVARDAVIAGLPELYEEVLRCRNGQ